MLTEGRSADEPSTGFRSETSWPPAGVRELRYRLGQGEATFRDLATSTEERSTRMPAAQTDWFFFQGPPLARDRRMAGSAVLDLTLELDRDHGHLTPVLVDVAPDGTTKTVSRGFLNLLYRNGLSRSQAVPVGEPIRARVTFKPQDQIFRAGHRIGVLVQGSNTVWAVPDDPGRRLHARPRPVEPDAPADALETGFSALLCGLQRLADLHADPPVAHHACLPRGTDLGPATGRDAVGLGVGVVLGGRHAVPSDPDLHGRPGLEAHAFDRRDVGVGRGLGRRRHDRRRVRASVLLDHLGRASGRRRVVEPTRPIGRLVRRLRPVD